MPPPDYVADADPRDLKAARLLYDHVVDAADPLPHPRQISLLRILWHSLRERYPVYAAHADAGPSKRIPAAAAAAGT